MNHTLEDLEINEYTSQWKYKNLRGLKNTLLEIQEIERKPRKYKTHEAFLLGNFMENLTRTGEAILVLSMKHFEAEMIMLAGMMIEGAAMMFYCLKNSKADCYMDYLTINGLLLEYREAEVGSPSPKQITSYIDELEKLEGRYIKAGKNYIEAIVFLRSDNNSYTDKKNKLMDSYKKFPKRSIESMVDEFIKEKIEKAVYEKYCHIKHHHFNNNVLYQERGYWQKKFSPFDELNAISSALDILKNLTIIYKDMKKKGDIEEKTG